MEYKAKRALEDVGISIDVELLDGTRIATLYSAFKRRDVFGGDGQGAFSCRVAGLPLRPDTYSLNVFISAPRDARLRRARHSFDIAPVDVFGTGQLPQRNQGPLIADYRWRASEDELVAAAPAAS